MHVDEAPYLKRWRPVSRGRAHPILKRSSHLTIEVGIPEAAVEIENQ
ncbi:MAG: uL22 family ribosomal protein [Rubricoccaceae bacterium]|nr:uL22 family ribosomal protein [Rubricoccaceae bacterium]